MSYADRGAFVIGCRACGRECDQPARFSSSSFGSRRGHFDVMTNLVGGFSSSLSEAGSVIGAMSVPMKLGMVGMLLGTVLLLRGDIKL